MSLRLYGMAGLSSVAMVAIACGGAAAPTPTATRAPVAAATATRAAPSFTPTAAPAAPTPTPTRAATPTATVPPPPAKSAGRVVIAIAEAGTQRLDPATSLTGSETAVKSSLYDGLLGTALDGSLEGRLAISWRAGEKAMFWEYKLRPGVKFHNGDSLVAEDVKFSFERAMADPTSTGAPGLRLRIASVEALDPQTVRINMKLPFAIWDTSGSGTEIVPKGYIDKIGKDQFGKAPVGTGPYKFVDRRLDEFIAYEAFEGHWRRPPFTKYFTLSFVPEPSVRLAMLKTREADVIGGVDPNMAKEIRSAPGLRLIRAEGTAMMWMWPFGASKIGPDGVTHVENKESPWANKLVRQAANYGVNREDLVRIYDGDAAPAVTTVRRATWGFNPSLKPYPYDPKKARELLAQAGYPDGFTTDLYFTNQAGMPYLKEVTVAVAGMWAGVGIKSNLLQMDYGSYQTRIRARQIDGLGIVVNATSQPNAWGAISGFASARGCWCSMMFDTSIDDDLDRAAGESDPEKRLKMVQDLMAREYEMAANVFLLYGNTSYGVNSRIRDWPQQQGSGYIVRVDLLQLN